MTDAARRADEDRPPLSEPELRAALIRPGSLVTDLRLVAETGSTNDDLAALARAGAPEGTVLVAEAQRAGRGRLDRTWVSPARAGLTFSVLLRPPQAVPPHRRTWLPLLAGLALQQAVSGLCTVPARLKWPNDLLLGDRLGKAAGILAQSEGAAIVLGVGMNVTTRAGELPAGATSLAVEAPGCTDRQEVLRAVLDGLGALYRVWCAADGAPGSVRPRYEQVCDTVGRAVRVQLPDGGTLAGTATGLDDAGRLLIDTPAGPRPVSAGDVILVRPVQAH